jgi:hypothetical protein
MEKKECSKCNQHKNIDQFAKSLKYTRSYCKSCANEIRKVWISKNKEKEKEYNSRYRPNQIEKYKSKQLAKQESNKCLKCKCSLIGMSLLANYCLTCKKEVRKQWKRESYKRCVQTYKNYFQKNKQNINNNNRKLELDRREKLADRYIKKLLIEKSGFKIDQLNQHPEIIQTKRLIIQTQRLWKTSQI